MHQRVFILSLDSLLSVVCDVVSRLLMGLTLDFKCIFALYTRFILAVRLLPEALRLLTDRLVRWRKVALFVFRNYQILIERSLILQQSRDIAIPRGPPLINKLFLPSLQIFSAYKL